jgi:threonylcarbamoyladenosine tRNA methylthiotransferase MtaB
MRRRYQRELYVDRVEKIKTIIPDCCIGVDVIVGFPTETEKDFQDTYDFLNNMDISYLHVFSYSLRANTKALDFENVVTIDERKQRSKLLHDLSEVKQTKFYNNFIGLERKVLFEAQHNGTIQGHTDNYIKVLTKGTNELVNKIVSVQLIENKTSHVVGKI